MNRIAIVTGGSSGIGRATAGALATRGVRVYEFSRRHIAAEGVIHISTDITDPTGVAAAVAEVIAREGRIDILVNNAGMGISGAVEFTEPADAHRQMEVNFHGAANVAQAVIPHMRAAGGGRIVNVSSAGGPLPLPFQAYYSASKAALNAWSMALANEVRPFGITVCAVLPGDIASGFTDARTKSPAGDDVYAGRIARSVAGMERDERGGMSPAVAGRRIASLAMRRSSRPLVGLGFPYRIFLWLAKVLPAGVLNRAIGLLYAK